MTDPTIGETIAAIDRALAGIAIRVAGGHAGVEPLMTALARGEQTPAAREFLAESAALLRARLLLSEATGARPARFSLRKAA